MRVSNISIHNAINQTLNESRKNLRDKQIQISSGEKYVKLSDNPVETSQISQIKQNDTKNSQWIRNLDFGINWSKHTTARTDQVLENMHRLNEIGTQANNQSQTSEFRKNLALEVDTIIKDLIAIGNSKAGESFLFGGAVTNKESFLANETSGKISSVSYAGNNENKRLQLNDSSTIKYGITGGGTDGLFIAESQNVNIFENAINIRDALQNGDVPSDDLLADVKTNFDHVINKLVMNGINEKRLTTLNDNYRDVQVIANERLNQLESVDMTKALTDLTQLESSFQASLQMAARVDRLSIMNYL